MKNQITLTEIAAAIESEVLVITNIDDENEPSIKRLEELAQNLYEHINTLNEAIEDVKDKVQ